MRNNDTRRSICHPYSSLQTIIMNYQLHHLTERP